MERRDYDKVYLKKKKLNLNISSLNKATDNPIFSILLLVMNCKTSHPFTGMICLVIFDVHSCTKWLKVWRAEKFCIISDSDQLMRNSLTFVIVLTNS